MYHLPLSFLGILLFVELQYLYSLIYVFYHFTLSFPGIFLFVSAMISIFYALYGKLHCKISFLQPLKEIRFKQENYKNESQLRKQNEEIADFYIELGNSLLDAGQLNEAKAAFKKAYSIIPHNIAAHLGILKTEVFQPIAIQDPTYYDKQRSLKKLRFIEELSSNKNLLNEPDPKDIFAKDPDLKNLLIKEPNLGNIFIKDPDLKSLFNCEPNLEKRQRYIEDFNSKDRHVLYYYGEVYRDDNPEIAKMFFVKVIVLTIESELAGRAYFGLAWITLRNDKEIPSISERRELALGLAKQAESKSKNLPLTVNGLGYMHLINKNYPETINILKKLLEDNPYLWPSYMTIIQAYRMTGNIEESYNYSNKLIHCLDNKDTYSIELNRKLSFVEKNKKGEIALIKGIPNRTYYAFLSVALTYYLYKDEVKSRSYIKKAQQISYCDQKSFREVIYYQIECIKEAYTRQHQYWNLIPRLNEFREIIKKLE